MPKREYNETQITGTITPQQSIRGKATAGAGVTDHNRLYNRDAEDQHPIEAITGLREELDNKLDSDTALPLIEEALRTKAAGLYYDAKKELARKAYWYLTSEIDPNTKMGTKESVISGPYDLGQGGGGGGGGVTKVTISLVGWPTTVVYGASTNLTISWSSVIGDPAEPTGPGTLYVSVNDKQVLVKSNVAQGLVTFEIGSFLKSGNNSVKVSILDAYGTQGIKVATLNVVSLELKSDFNYNLNFTGEILYTYIPYGNVDKLVHFIVDGDEYGTQLVKTTDERQSYRITGLNHGSHTLKVYFTANIDGAEVYSNELFYDLVYYEAGNSTPIIVSDFNDFEQEQYIPFNISYRVFIWNKNSADIQLLVDDVQYGETLTVNFNPQVWNYKNDVPANYKLQIKCDDIYKTFNVHIAESQIDVKPVTDSLVLALSAQGRSNNEPLEERMTWNYENIHCEMTNFNWASDGWLLDDENSTVLRLSGNARVRIPYKPFEADAPIKNYGKTIELEIATRSVMNYNATIISCLDGGRGFYVTPQIAALTSLQAEISTQYKEDDHVRLAFVIEKSNETRLIWMYINGIASGAIQYQTSDSFMQPTPVDIILGSNEAVLDIYNIRIYDNNLSSKQIVNNWIADTQNASLKAQRYYHNDNYNDRGELVIEKLPSDLPYIIWDIDPMPADKNDRRPGRARYVDPMDSSRNYEALNAEYRVQGTSSAAYPVKNIRTKYKQMKDPYASYKFEWYDDNGDPIKKYAITIPDGIADNYFTYKVDFASSEGANNVELVRLYNDACKKATILTPPQKQNSKIRIGIDGFPIIAFHQDADGNITFYSKANFNNDKANEAVYGFDGQWTSDAKTFWDGDESWETTNNTSDIAKFKIPVTPENFDDAFEVRYPDEDNYTRLAKKPGEEGYDPAKYEADLERLVPILSRLSEMTTWVASTYRKDTDSTAVKQQKLEKFRTELEDHFNKKSSIFYYIFTHLFLMVDSRAKNAFPTYFKSRTTGDGGDRWFWLPYDMDTAIGINNEGKLVFDYSLEDTDTVNGANVFNGQDSVFWCNLRDAFADDIKEMYTQLRTQRLIDYDYVENMFEEHQAKWSENIFNEDAKNKYIAPLATGDNYLEMLQGAKAEQRKWWLYNRFKYFDSKYTAGDAFEDRIQFRAYVPAGTVKPNITITPYADIYATVRFTNGKDVSKRSKRGEESIIINPYTVDEWETDQETYIYSASQLKSIGDISGFRPDTVKIGAAIKLQDLKIGDDSIVEAQAAIAELTEDQEVNPEKIYYTREYTGEPAGYFVDDSGYRYTEVEEPDPSDLPIYYEVLYKGQDAGEYINPNLKELTIGNNTLLRTLNAKNCINLKQAIDASKCVNIEEIYFDKTAIPSITLPDGGILKHLHLPATLTTLTIKNQPQLTDLVLAGTSNLEKLWLENIPGSSIDVYTLVSAMETGKYIRLIGIDEDYTALNSTASLAKIEELYGLLDTMGGLNDRGEEIRITEDNPHPARHTVTGTIRVSEISYRDWIRLQAWYPEVAISAAQIWCQVEFDPDNGQASTFKNVARGYTTTAPEDPIKEPSISTLYTFKYWYYGDEEDPTIFTPETVIMTDLVYKADYARAPRPYTVIFDKQSQAAQIDPSFRVVGFGSTFDPPIFTALPQDADFAGWYTEVNTEWHFESDPIQGNMTLYAQWTDNKHPQIENLEKVTYNTFKFDASDNVGIAAYAVTKSDVAPLPGAAVWIPVSGSPTSCTLTHTISEAGIYYVWVLDNAATPQVNNVLHSITAAEINAVVATGSSVLLEEDGATFTSDFALTNTVLNVISSRDSHYEDLKLYINNELQDYTTVEVTIIDVLSIRTECTPRNYTITFHKQNSEARDVPPQIVTYLHYIDKPDAQYVNRAVISGWYLEETCETEWNFNTMVVESDLDLYADWVPYTEPTTITIEIPTIPVDDPDRLEKLKVIFNYNQGKPRALLIDWGDGSPIEESDEEGSWVAKALEHNYTNDDESKYDPVKDVYTYNIRISSPLTVEPGSYVLGNGYYATILGCYERRDENENIIRSCTYITNVNFSAEISGSMLNAYALRNAKITNLCLTPYITFIPAGLFWSCLQLRNITIPNWITSLNDQAFAECTNLQSIIIPDNVTRIGQGVFANCRQLTTINLNYNTSKLTYIGEGAFMGCIALSHFRIPESVIEFGYAFPQGLDYCISNVFEGCPLLTTAGPYNSVDHNGDPVTVEYPWDDIIDYFGWTTLSEVVFSPNITYIGRCAFYYTKLGTVGPDIIDLSDKQHLTEIRDYAFRNAANSKTNKIREVKLPASLITLGKKVFENCSELQIIDIPASVRNIGESICFACLKLGSAIIRTTIIWNSPVEDPNEAWFRNSNAQCVIYLDPALLENDRWIEILGNNFHYYGEISGEPRYLDIYPIND